jgi:GDP-mannose transporter
MYSNSAERRGDEEKLMAHLGGAPRPPSPAGNKEAAAQTPTSREQALPILNYCAASIMMTVVNKVSRRVYGKEIAGVQREK